MNLVDFVKNLFKTGEVDAGYTTPQHTTTEVSMNVEVDRRGRIQKRRYIPREPHPRHRHVIEQIRAIADRAGYVEIDLQEINKMISFKRGGVRINVYYTTMTVGTCLDHPKQGKTQLFRHGVTLIGLEKLFTNPRQHTGRGYKQK